MGINWRSSVGVSDLRRFVGRGVALCLPGVVYCSKLSPGNAWVWRVSLRSTDVDHARVCTPRRRFVPGVLVRRGVAVTARLVVAVRGCTPSACCTARGRGRWTRVCATRSAVRRGRRVCCMRHQHAAGCRRSASAVFERIRSAAAGVGRHCTPRRGDPRLYALCLLYGVESAAAGRGFVQDVLLYGVEGVSVVCVISHVAGCRRSASAVIKRVRCGGLPRRRRWRAHASVVGAALLRGLGDSMGG